MIKLESVSRPIHKFIGLAMSWKNIGLDVPSRPTFSSTHGLTNKSVYWTQWIQFYNKVGNPLFLWGQGHIKVKGHLKMWNWPHLKSWKSDRNQTWFIGIIWKPSYVHEVKGHISRSKVIWGQVVRQAENVKLTTFEKLKSNWNQTWLIGIIWEPSYVHEVKGHISRSKVI